MVSVGTPGDPPRHVGSQHSATTATPPSVSLPALGPLGDRADDTLGTLFFPEQLTQIDRVLLPCRYRTVEG
ncbi:hypothetical protein QFZ67_007000 [Streptomyces sp. V1I1]|nr:hypothetical protein [Streptomyces sp. V1I1]